MTVKREDPRPSRLHVRGINWKPIVAQIKELDGDFGNVGTFSPGTAQYLRKGGYKEFLPDGYTGDPHEYMKEHYQVTARSVSRAPDRVDIFVRWRG